MRIARPARAGSTAASRRGDLDWVRLGLTATSFLYRSVRFWGTGSSGHGDWAVDLCSGRAPDLVDACLVGLFLMISGAAIRSALAEKGPRAFLVDRVSRLFVPFLFGVLLLSPPQVYLELRRTGTSSRSIAAFLRGSLEGLHGVTPGGSFAFHGFHLAYLFLLFALSVACMPVFVALRHAAAPARAAARAALVAAILLPPLSFRLPPEIGWLPAAAAALIGGFLLLDGATFQRSLIAARWGLSAGGILAALASCASPSRLTILLEAGVWALELGLLAFVVRHLGRVRPPRGSLREAGVLCFILSRPLVVAAASWARAWPLTTFCRSAVVALSAGGLCVALSLLVRRRRFLRLALGVGGPVEPRRKRDARPAGASRGVRAPRLPPYSAEG